MPPRTYSQHEIDSLTDKEGFNTLSGRKDYLTRRMALERQRRAEARRDKVLDYLTAPGVPEAALCLVLTGLAHIIAR